MRFIIAPLLLIGFAVSVAVAQRSPACIVPGTEDIGIIYMPWLGVGGGAGWQKGASVTLYIVSPTTGGFTSGQITDIETAFSNWNSTSGSNLTITNSVITSAAACLSNGTCSSPPYPPTYILVQFGQTSQCDAGYTALACTAYNYNTTTGYSTYSVINVSTSVGSGGIRPLMAHEIGHTYLFADCLFNPRDYTCTATLTLMDPTQITNNSPTSPLCCDLDLLFAITPEFPYGAYCKQ